MAEPKRDELKLHQKRAVLVAVHFPESPIPKEHVLDELQGLVKTAGVHVVGTLVQSRERPDPATCLGKGKVEELKTLIEQTDAKLVIFDNNLTPAQGRQLETSTNSVIVDRSEVILDIFASHARTHEAQLQVELAQLLYFRPRLKRLWTHLERIEGGIGSGRGPGEKQLETDRRLVDKRVDELKRRLAEIEKRRKQTVNRRNEQLTVSLVGYTNAGKSTLMNALTGSDVYVADQLFATLDTRTRSWKIPQWGDVLISDTVGFIRDLPHHLVASFRSTLEEARQADLLWHVVDASNLEAELQIQTVEHVLTEIGVPHERMLLVFNKIDAVEDPSYVDVLRRKHPDAVSVSARTGQGFDRLMKATADRLSDGYVDAIIETSAGNGRLLAFLARFAEVKGTEYHESRVTLNCRLPKRTADRLNLEDAVVSYPSDPLFAPILATEAGTTPTKLWDSDQQVPMTERRTG
ncbi:MAG: GTPase HflX [Planctomycetota bacterium]|nr:GTPase HflX [Planctomycetota bacterium]MDA1211109.1 GTPase HflX [Planctomycetota bacterium]